MGGAAHGSQYWSADCLMSVPTPPAETDHPATWPPCSPSTSGPWSTLPRWTPERLTWLVGLAHRADVLEVDGEVGGFVVTFRPGSDYDSENYRWFADRYGRDFYYLDRIVVAEHLRRPGLARSSTTRWRPSARDTAG